MARTASRSFWLKYRERWENTRSLVCIGLDSDIRQLPECVLSEPNPIWEFNRRIIDETAEHACAYKPNLAFYLSDGTRGLEALERTVDYIPEDIPVILDSKTGDIGSTMEQYCVSFFDRMRFDAITLNPLMGSDVLDPVLQRENAFAFALALTSNISAQDFFHGVNMAEKVSLWMREFPLEKVGAVVGATQVNDLQRMRLMLPGRIFLIPGIGAQGGDIEAVMKYATDTKDYPNILINSSRGIIFKEKTPQFAQAAGIAARELKNQSLA
jgi:orotidine-5'-phosphate decarboxylase